MRLPPLEIAALSVVKIIKKHGFTAYWAGGAVRDILLKIEPHDIDIATNASPKQILKIFTDSNHIGKAFGIIRVKHQGIWFEIATFRKDSVYSDGRHPDKVEFSDEKTDAERRDFTINSIFYDPVSRRFIDYVNGMKDIKSRLIRCTGDSDSRFKEDHLRIMRAVRFASVLDFSIEKNTSKAMKNSSLMLSRISAERIRDELFNTLSRSSPPSRCIGLYSKHNIFAAIFPALRVNAKYWKQTGQLLDKSRIKTIPLFMALMLRILSADHKGINTARRICGSLRIANRQTDEICHLLGSIDLFKRIHLYKITEHQSFITNNAFPEKLEFLRLLSIHNKKLKSKYNLSKSLAGKFSKKDRLLINGRDLIMLGLKQGPEIGAWLKKAHEIQLSRSIRDKDELLIVLRRYLEGNML